MKQKWIKGKRLKEGLLEKVVREAVHDDIDDIDFNNAKILKHIDFSKLICDSVKKSIHETVWNIVNPYFENEVYAFLTDKRIEFVYGYEQLPETQSYFNFDLVGLCNDAVEDGDELYKIIETFEECLKILKKGEDCNG